MNLSNLVPGVAVAKIYVVAALALALGGFVVWALHEHSEVAKLSASLKTAQNENQQLRETNASNQSTITSLQTAVGEWKKLVPTPEAAKAAADRMASAAKALEDRAASIAAQSRADNALPACTAFLTVDVAAVCPAHADGVRRRAAPGGLPGPNGGSSGPRGGKATGQADAGLSAGL